MRRRPILLTAIFMIVPLLLVYIASISEKQDPWLIAAGIVFFIGAAVLGALATDSK